MCREPQLLVQGGHVGTAHGRVLSCVHPTWPQALTCEYAAESGGAADDETDDESGDGDGTCDACGCEDACACKKVTCADSGGEVGQRFDARSNAAIDSHAETRGSGGSGGAGGFGDSFDPFDPFGSKFPQGPRAASDTIGSDAAADAGCVGGGDTWSGEKGCPPRQPAAERKSSSTRRASLALSDGPDQFDSRAPRGPLDAANRMDLERFFSRNRQ